MNSVAKSFPDKTRATAAGSVLAGFGLSAFLFSTISHTFFPGNTGDFLFLLAIGCFIPMFLGVFLVVPIPPPKHRPHPHHTEESNWGRIASSSSATGYLPIPDQSDAESTSGAETEEDDDETHTPRVRTRRDGTIIELSPSRSFKSNEGDDEEGILTKVTSRVSVVPSVAGGDDGEGMTGMRLMKELDFWILAAIVCCLSGSGLMWINNCGLSTLALVTKGNPVYDPELLSKLQATQVSTISIWNCAGRILLGVITDVAKHRFSIRRIHFMSLVSSLFILSQVAALYTTDVRSLWIVSSLLGVAYGGLFGLAPVICLEWFGLANFSLNWGFVSMSPILGGNVANLVYGRVYDSHTVGKIAKAALALVRSPPVLDPSDRSHDCFLGQGCYVQAFHVTTTATVLALALSLFAGWRREKASRERKRRASMLVVGSAA
ncbi:major facilitator superfamily domain-containing protein [Mrakia frigida]|uniref:major facilitator superfamily domain-containing protein n=1 Tax=Mrakia frigida TaxID=29902 RepID=UPI003FCC1304